ncbi:MAG: HEPN domain-containing protein [Anaerolineales bacterium]|nr:HEPN domain-containing protein [Anaerolineales bacterium]
MVEKVLGHGEKILRETQTPYLVGEEREALARFLARLESECGDAIRRVILYGSKARGGTDAESDTDLLVVTADESAMPRIEKIEYDFNFETDAGISSIIVSQRKYDFWQSVKHTLYVNIRRDGVELWDPVAWASEENQFPLDFVEGEFRQMDDATRKTIRYHVDNARYFWEQGLLLKEKFLRGAVSRAYYAAFHMATAALYAVNVVRGKHRGVEGAISQFLVKPGLIESEYHKMFGELMRGRIVSDYGGERDPDGRIKQEILPDAVMEQMLKDAERFIARMEQFLRVRGAIE